jgi:hypothetical protein
LGICYSNGKLKQKVLNKETTGEKKLAIPHDKHTLLVNSNLNEQKVVGETTIPREGIDQEMKYSQPAFRFYHCLECFVHLRATILRSRSTE